MKRLIVTGDDFGLAVSVNEAIEVAHRSGILSAASLMVGAPAAADAVERARRLPTLRVGLHLVLVRGRAVLPATAIPALVNEHGEFSDNLVAAGFRFFFSPTARRQLEAEVRAQFAAFRQTGLPLDHVNTHNHMHLHPTVLSVILTVGRDFGLGAVRVPYEPPVRSLSVLGREVVGRVSDALGLAPWIWLLKSRLRRAGIRANDFLFGLRDTGAMDEPAVLRLLSRLPEGVTEMYFHPAARRCPELVGLMPAYRHEHEFAALVSPRVRAALEREGIRPIGFRDL
ncbi:MAG: hopanoid biosynthesis-associated protein HpnK [Thermodesulfobacteriota bacterium]